MNVGIISNAAGGKLIFSGRFRFIEFHYFYPVKLFFHFTGAMIEAKTHAAKNTLYFHAVVEIPRRLISYGLFGWRKCGQLAGFGTEEFLKSGRQLSSIRSGQNSRSSDG